MSVKKISEAILGVGVDDTTIDLFESQYPVPTGVSYNSYVILDEKTAVLDTVDARATEPWLENLSEALAGRKPDYLVVSHMEPDHGANIAKLAALYPEMQVVGNAKTFLYMDQFFGADVPALVQERRQQAQPQKAACIKVEQKIQCATQKQRVAEHQRPQLPGIMQLHEERPSASAGSQAVPCRYSSKCRCAPVARPLRPAAPSSCPVSTTSPGRT